jgi:hypothetical protein
MGRKVKGTNRAMYGGGLTAQSEDDTVSGGSAFKAIAKEVGSYGLTPFWIITPRMYHALKSSGGAVQWNLIRWYPKYAMVKTTKSPHTSRAGSGVACFLFIKGALWAGFFFKRYPSV